MAIYEKFLSPGVFVSEQDKSFLAPGIQAIGATVIGQFSKGQAFEPIACSNYEDFINKFGNTDPLLPAPYAAREYLKYGAPVNAIRVLGTGSWSMGTYMYAIYSQSATTGALYATVALNSGTTLTMLPAGASFTSSDAFSLYLDGVLQTPATLSLHPNDSNFIGNVFNTNPSASNAVFLARNFAFPLYNVSAPVTLSMAAELSKTFAASGYAEAVTPWIQSQLIGGTRSDLFRIHTLQQGNAVNTSYKIGFSSIQSTPNTGSTAYGTFNVIVRDFNDSDARPSILQNFNNCTLDPNSPNYIASKIGDIYKAYNITNDNYDEYGEYPVTNPYIRIEMAANVDAVPPAAVPMGFGNYSVMHNVGILQAYKVAQLPVKTTFTGTESGDRYWYGIDYQQKSISDAFLSLPNTPNASTGSFTIESLPSTSFDTNGQLSWRKFIVPVFGGEDGINPSYALDLNSLAGMAGEFKLAGKIATNQMLFDTNLLVTPGVTDQTVTSYISNLVDGRSDILYVIDPAVKSATVSDVIAAANKYDTSYGAMYWPWCSMWDANISKYTWVPPSVAAIGAIKQSDSLSFEWWAPAGLNRAALHNVNRTSTRLSQTDIDNLYINRVNPIVNFPRDGIVIWGQKTLQIKESLLTKINVRRLLIYAKKLIASVTRFLVFEPNDQALWSQFKNLVNPILRDIQEHRGLYNFQVIMDSTTNTPDLIDRGIAKGIIRLQPTPAAEYFDIGFTIEGSGAAFEQ